MPMHWPRASRTAETPRSMTWGFRALSVEAEAIYGRVIG